MDTRAAVGVDIGGTKIAAGVVTAAGEVVHRARRDTPREAETITPVVASLVQELRAEAGLDAGPVGVGAAGIVDADGVVRYAPNIAWADFPLAEQLRRVLGGPVTVDNDANVAAWGEYRAGAGRGAHSDMLLLTIGTGVGGGLVIGDRLLRGAHGLGAELGHIIVAEGGPRCPCGNAGCLEALASGTAVGRMAREALASGQPSAPSALADVTPADLTGKAVTTAAASGDDLAIAVLARAGFWLGVGIASLVNAIDPETVVVGGGAMEAGELLLAPARAAFEERLLGRAHRPLPSITRASLGDDAGLIGAALLAMEAPHADAD